jgi:hypothetical protein
MSMSPEDLATLSRLTEEISLAEMAHTSAVNHYGEFSRRAL